MHLNKGLRSFSKPAGIYETSYLQKLIQENNTRAYGIYLPTKMRKETHIELPAQ